MRFKKIFPNGFEPTFLPERLKEPYELKKPAKIFVCSIADLFAPWTDEGWANTVLTAMLECPIKHDFQMLTKNPERIMMNWILRRLDRDTNSFIPKNWWFGTTVTSESRPALTFTANTISDMVNIDLIKHVPATVRFVSFEPLLGPINFDAFSLKDIQWIIIGKLTGSSRVKLKWEWVENILKEADKYGIPVFMKKNLIPKSPEKYLGQFKKDVGWKIPSDFKLRQEFPHVSL